MKTTITSLAFIGTITTLPATTIIEEFNFSDTAGTELAGAANSAGSASFTGATANAVTDNGGNLVYSVGADASSNIFRNANLTTSDVTTGVYELSFAMSGTIAGGDATGANVGYGLRDSVGGDLFLVRLQRQNSTLRLQTRIGSTNTDLENFGATTVTDLTVRAVFDLGTDTMDVFWSENGGAEQSSTGITINDLEMDQLRAIANTNTNDWGATDTVSVDYLRLTQIPEPSSTALLGLGGIALILRRRK